MKTEVFDGKAFAQEILKELKKEVAVLEKKPNLVVVSFGAGQSNFIRRKEETAEFLGVGFKHYGFEEAIGTKEARQRLNQITKANQTSAVVIQLPLPKNINPSILNVIPLRKDPDFLSDKMVGLFFNNRAFITPPTAKAIIAILGKSNIELAGKEVSVFGYGALTGRFLVKLLLDRKAAVRVAAHPADDNKIKKFTKGVDVVISAVGSPHFLNGELLPEGAVVVDAGFSTVDGDIRGDVNFEAAQDRFRLIVPVPGGVGPVGVAMLFKNIVSLAERK